MTFNSKGTSSWRLYYLEYDFYSEPKHEDHAKEDYKITWHGKYNKKSHNAIIYVFIT